ncbi:hypothetical protein KEM48_000007 [Puccinia striiformis f. sp. tritici PST-130]|nr:hypothetical protein KEM48_000007 [Puccinia striiformis f. sp. tritici PST-130]
MVRRPSPLAQSTQSSPAPQQFASVPQSVAPDTQLVTGTTTTSYRNSSAFDHEDSEPPLMSIIVHLATDLLLVLASTAYVQLHPTRGHPLCPTITALADRTPNKHSKHSLSNKLRRALSINALHENMIHESIPELAPAIGHERIKSSSASIAGVPSAPVSTPTAKVAASLAQATIWVS